MFVTFVIEKLLHVLHHAWWVVGGGWCDWMVSDCLVMSLWPGVFCVDMLVQFVSDSPNDVYTYSGNVSYDGFHLCFGS